MELGHEHGPPAPSLSTTQAFLTPTNWAGSSQPSSCGPGLLAAFLAEFPDSWEFLSARFCHFFSWFSLSFTFFFWNHRSVSCPRSAIQGENAQPGQDYGLGNLDPPPETVQTGLGLRLEAFVDSGCGPPGCASNSLHGSAYPPLVSGGSSSVRAWTLLCLFPTPSHLPTPAFDFPQSLGCGYTLHFLVLRYQAGMARAWDEWENCHWPSMSPRAPWLHRDPPK